MVQWARVETTSWTGQSSQDGHRMVVKMQECDTCNVKKLVDSRIPHFGPLQVVKHSLKTLLLFNCSRILRGVHGCTQRLMCRVLMTLCQPASVIHDGLVSLPSQAKLTLFQRHLVRFELSRELYSPPLRI